MGGNKGIRNRIERGQVLKKNQQVMVTLKKEVRMKENGRGIECLAIWKKIVSGNCLDMDTIKIK